MLSIISPVDFTEDSVNAARYAADLANAIGADLHLVHAMNIPAIPAQVPIPDYVLDELRDSSQTSLENLAKELGQRTGGKVTVATDLETGEAESRIKGFCQWKKPFMVVINASTVSPIYHLPFPTLLVPRHAVFHSIRNILLACDQEDISAGVPAPFEFFLQLREHLGAHFDIIHVFTDERTDKKAERLKFNIWKDGLARVVPELHLITAGSVEEGVQEFLDKHEADWLIVFPKKNNLLRMHKSLSDTIIMQCPLPAMVVHHN